MGSGPGPVTSRQICRDVLAAARRIGHDTEVGSLAALLAAFGLAVIPYRFGSGRWHLAWMRTTYDIGLVLFVIFLPWFALAMGIGASGALVPVAMIMFAAAFGMGRWDIWRRVRSRR